MRSLLWITAIGSIGFIVYGSLVPFTFVNRSLADATDGFIWAMGHRYWPASRSDWIANVMLGVPLGFSLLGIVCPRSGSSYLIPWAIVLWPFTLVLGLTVEFLQLFVHGRTTASSDVAAQGLGALVGMIAWVELGPFLSALVSKTVLSSTPQARTTRILLIYSALLSLVLYLPLDLTLSPWELAKKAYRDVHYIPFSEFAVWDSGQCWEQIESFILLGMAYVPIGIVFGVRLQTVSECDSIGIWALLGFTLIVPLLFELGQLFVQSRLPTMSGVLAGWVGIITGITSRIVWHHRPKIFPLLAFGLWLLVMVVALWSPFEFGTSPMLSGSVLIPGAEIVYGDDLHTLERWLSRLIPYGLLGGLVSITCRQNQFVLAGIIALCLATGLEIGQLLIPSRTGSVTELLIAPVGAIAGAYFSQQISEALPTTEDGYAFAVH